MEIGYDWSSTAGIQWSPVQQLGPPLNNYYYYTLNWSGAKVNGNAITGVNFGTGIIDSGTTFAGLSQDYLTAFYNSLLGMCGSTNLVGICGTTYSTSIFNP